MYYCRRVEPSSARQSTCARSSANRVSEDDNRDCTPTNRILSLLHQEHSQYMISIGQEMIALLLDHFRVMPEFLEVVSNFRFREESTEEGYCSPCRIRRSPNDVGMRIVKTPP